MEEYGSCCKQREVLVDKSDRNSREYPLRNMIDRLHILPYSFLSREDDNEVEHIERHDFSSVLLDPMLSNANRCTHLILLRGFQSMPLLVDN